MHLPWLIQSKPIEFLGRDMESALLNVKVLTRGENYLPTLFKAVLKSHITQGKWKPLYSSQR